MHYVPPADNGLELIYRDESLLVVNKPAGLLSVPGRGADKQDSLTSRLQKEFPDALIVHRLDMATSGLLVFARSVAMQRRLSALFRERHVSKQYVARVTGRLRATNGEIDLPLGADWPNRPRQRVDFDTGKPSLTRFRLMDYSATGNTSRVLLEPVTGRTHQLRVHLRAIGHPIIGDMLYGGQTAERLMLHACNLGFSHPLNESRLAFSCDAPF
jgi:tRNA pseudouridine32 synthase/23S rRNA pseudouridine746 synthase